MDDEAPTHIASLQGLYERSTHLVLKLYDLSIRSSTCRPEIFHLTQQVESFPNSTRQIISWLLQAPHLPSPQALQDVQEISDECHHAFDRIEELSSRIHEIAAEGGQDTNAEKFNADSLLRKELMSLMTLLQSMLLTLNVMMHAFLSAKMSMDHDNNQAVEMIQKQIEGLVIRQQLVLISAVKLYRDFIESRPNPSNESISPTSIPFLEQQPEVLLRYQEISLQQFYFSNPGSESEILAQVLSVSRRQMWELLNKWTTRFGLGEPNSPQVQSHDFAVKEPIRKEKKRSKKNASKEPVVSESFYSATSWPTPDHEPTPEYMSNIITPTLTPTNSDPFQTDPIAIPGPSRMTRTYSAPIQIGLGISTSTPPPDYQSTTGPASVPLFQPRLPNRAPSVASTQSSARDTGDQEEDEPVIRWRIRYQKARWEFDNDHIVRTNTALPLKKALKSAEAITEIRRRKIARRVLEDHGYRYKRLPLEDREEWGKGGDPKYRDFWQIEGGLTYETICALVRETKELDYEPKQRSKRDRKPSVRQSRNTLNRSYSETTRRNSAMGQWPGSLETMEEHVEEARERKDKRDRRSSNNFDENEKRQDRRNPSTSVKRDSIRPPDYEDEEEGEDDNRRERRHSSTRERNQVRDGRDRDRKVVGTTSQALGLLTLLGPLAGLAI